MSVQKSDPTSVNLLARIQSGEKAAWHRLMTLYAPLIRFWCNQWGVAEIDLDDVIQEVWLVLGPRLGSYRPNAGCSFRVRSGRAPQGGNGIVGGRINSPRPRAAAMRLCIPTDRR